MPPATLDTRRAMPRDAFSAEIGNVEDVLKGLFEPQGEGEGALAAYRQEIARVAGAYAAVASSEDGQIVLEHLCDVTLRRPTFIAHHQLDPMRAYAMGCQREGANGLMFFVLQMIAQGRSEDPPQREGS